MENPDIALVLARQKADFQAADELIRYSPHEEARYFELKLDGPDRSGP